MRFTTRIVGSGGNTAGIEVPEHVVMSFGAGKRVPVVVTVGGHTYRSTVAPYKGPYMVSLSAENRRLAGVVAGDQVEVEIVHDTAPRETELDDDVRAALDAEPQARAFFDTLTASQQKAYTYWIGDAKKPETRTARIRTSVEMLAEGRRR